MTFEQGFFLHWGVGAVVVSILLVKELREELEKEGEIHLTGDVIIAHIPAFMLLSFLWEGVVIADFLEWVGKNIELRIKRSKGDRDG